MTSEPSDRVNWLEPYRPFFFEEITSITQIQNQNNAVLLSDKSRGLLAEVDLIKAKETIKKSYSVNDFAEVNSISYYDSLLYSVYQNKVYTADYGSSENTLKNKLLVEIPNVDELTGIAVTQGKIYLVTAKQSILAYDRKTEEIETIGHALGVGSNDLCYHEDKLFMVDAKEQTIYVFDLKNRSFIYEILTPFENPTGIAPVYQTKLNKKAIYVSYSRPSFEVYDTGDNEFDLQIDATVKDNFIYPLNYLYNTAKKAILSNGFLVEMYYVEKLHALPEIADEYRKTKKLDWKISLPMNTDRQQLISVEPIGNFEMRIEEIANEENRQMAIFSLPELDLNTERRVFGWKCVVKIAGIRYYFNEDEIRALTVEELQQFEPYLKNDSQLDMDSSYVQEAAQEAVASLSERDRKNIVKKAQAIRDYIYTKLIYVMDRYHNGTEDILRQGEGACGEYLNVFLSLFRLNGIPVRECGNYKVPTYKMQVGSRAVFLSPDFNHVWLQFYVPDVGWVPLESSADDEATTQRDWAKRYFMSLAWYHMECRIGSYFEDVFAPQTGEPYLLAPGDLAKKDLKFKVIRELENDELASL